MDGNHQETGKGTNLSGKWTRSPECGRRMPSTSQAARAVSDVLGDGGGIDQVVQCEGAVDQEHGDSGEGDGVDQMQSHGRESFR